MIPTANPSLRIYLTNTRGSSLPTKQRSFIRTSTLYNHLATSSKIIHQNFDASSRVGEVESHSGVSDQQDHGAWRGTKSRAGSKLNLGRGEEAGKVDQLENNSKTKAISTGRRVARGSHTTYELENFRIYPCDPRALRTAFHNAHPPMTVYAGFDGYRKAIERTAV